MDVQLALPTVAAQLAVPIVLLGLAPVGRERVGGWLGMVTRIASIAHASLVILVEIGAVSLLAETARGPMHCGTGFAGLFVMMMALTALSAAAALLFAACCAFGSDSTGFPRLLVFLGSLLMGSVLFTTWMAPFLFVGHPAIGTLSALLATVSTGLTALLVRKMTVDA